MDRRGVKAGRGPAGGRASPCVCNTLRMVTRAVTQLYDEALQPSGLRVTQFSILASIARAGAPTHYGALDLSSAREAVTSMKTSATIGSAVRILISRSSIALVSCSIFSLAEG